ncbi:GNAT family N-acetyltransferase [Brachybacterium sp. DNPG3]
MQRSPDPAPDPARGPAPGSAPGAPALLADRLEIGGRVLSVARARAADLPELVALLADDVLGRERELSGEHEGEDLAPYERAFAAIDADAEHHLLVVVRDEDGALAATLQLTLLPSLSRGGATRLQIEAVRVASGLRGAGLGTALLDRAHEWGRAQGATLAQLTTDRARPDAHRFYERVGYTASHVGFKRTL